ncbi:oxidoreductase, 2OG-Fe(II) oxygenase family, putative [Talaromyces stipitatus ATCC 10500]|uniref:Oxidoreductase, 2OG-Fe(II) oxygenase family, putative n=1 Tax=Talaromyces stipitatus (strain ATCC 10500 / CBS 375.48 / QM 6759 / NRRL 1006) TaxID=441959 RepID=B8M351_TALSN|nr:oxidoreductase, 2OG-Fe(II) oxygenase family, putative [Talaromyces stipitatus ATCC 10500]EED22027.1 oxidoreductase, 2OG-Fe(II) oxygenase family, putative [Talaromyces stipitatus ATCC 10500]
MASPIQLPIIDISDPLNPAVGKDMLDAAIKYGFFYVHGKGSDFSAAEVDSTFDLSKKFFALPNEEKEKCRIRTDNRGWSGMHSEILDPEHQRNQLNEEKRALNFGEFKNGKLQQPLPPALEPHEGDIKHFTNLCNKTAARVMRLLALGLEIDPEFFVTRHDASRGSTGCILRFLYYPSINSPASSSYQHDIDVRAGAHSDYGTITLLFQRPGQPGLEILTADGSWAPVPVWPEAAAGGIKDDFPPILINIGDMLSFWTNGLLKSTIHRVVFPLAERSPAGTEADTKPQDRYSVVFFCHPLNDCNLVPPVPSPLVAAAGVEASRVGFGGGAGSLKERSSMTAKEYLDLRLSATYGEREKV